MPARILAVRVEVARKHQAHSFPLVAKGDRCWEASHL